MSIIGSVESEIETLRRNEAPSRLVSEVVLLCVRELEKWARARPEFAALARLGIGDAGRVLWIVNWFGITSVEELLAEKGFSLVDFGRSVRAMTADLDYQLARYRPVAATWSITTAFPVPSDARTTPRRA